MEDTISITALDIQKAVKDSCKATEMGSGIYKEIFAWLKPKCYCKTKTLTGIKTQRILSQLRAGYCYLNEYLNKVGVKDLPVCDCGDPETVYYFIDQFKHSMSQ